MTLDKIIKIISANALTTVAPPPPHPTISIGSDCLALVSFILPSVEQTFSQLFLLENAIPPWK